MTPAEYLAELQRHLGRLPPPVAAWLSAGLRRYRSGMDLETSLELTGPGARRYRDDCLRRAAGLIAPNETPWAQAGKLRDALAYCEPMAARVRADPARLDTYPPFQREIIRALNCGPPVPRSRRQLHTVLAAEIQGPEFSRLRDESSGMG